MVIRSTQLFAFLMTASLVVSCSKSKDVTPEENDVYVFGAQGQKATYWKNGVPTTLSQHAGSVVYCGVMSGPDLYFGGFEIGGTYWKNGGSVNIPRNRRVLRIFPANADLYIAGEFSPVTGGGVAAYWKNGVPTILGDSTIGFSSANSIVISGNDVHVVGWQVEQVNVNDFVIHGRYWKNGVLVPLPITEDYCYLYDLALVGADVYVVGAESPDNNIYVGEYWKNGVVTKLTPPGGSTNRITIDGSDVYIAGYSGGAMYWKNGTAVQVNGADACTDIASSAGDVFVTVVTNSQSTKMLKNGQAVSPFDGSDASMNLLGVFAVTK